MPENLLESLPSPLLFDAESGEASQQAPEHMFLIDRDGRLLGTDGWLLLKQEPTSVSVTGQPASAEQRQELPIDTATRKRITDEVARTGKPVDFDTLHDNIVNHCTMSPLFSAAGAIDYFLLSISNTITGETAKNVNRQPAALSELYDTIPASILIIDEQMQLVGWNRFSRDTINGLRDNEMPGINPLNRVHPDDRTAIERKIQNIIRFDIEESAEFRMFHKNEPPYKWAMFRGKKTFIDGKPCMIAVVAEITEFKEAEKKQKKLQEKLHQYQKMELIGQLAGGIAHDFNNALAAILGNTELALGKLDPSSRVTSYINDIHKLALRSAEMTRQLLAFARKQVTIPKVFNLAEAISECLHLHLRLTDEKIRVEWEHCDNQVKVKLDPTQLEQIFSNLFINARDAITGAGTIRIDCRCLEIDHTLCNTGMTNLAPGNYVKLSVSDTGCGIDETTLPHIYEPFFTTKEIGKGTGLGLSTVYGIVMQNRGYIECASEPGKGTTFDIWLPIHHDRPEQQRQGNTNEIARNSKTTIMVVEDEPYILNLISDILEGNDFTVLTASNAEEGLQKAAEYDYRIDLLVSDVVLPTINGIEMSRLIRLNNPAMKLLFMSAHAPENVSRQKKLRPGVDFIQKPFGINDFVEAVRQVLKSSEEEDTIPD